MIGIELAVHTLTKHLPVSEAGKAKFRLATEVDPSLQQVRRLTMEGCQTQHESTGRYVTNYM